MLASAAGATTELKVVARKLYRLTASVGNTTVPQRPHATMHVTIAVHFIIHRAFRSFNDAFQDWASMPKEVLTEDDVSTDAGMNLQALPR